MSDKRARRRWLVLPLLVAGAALTLSVGGNASATSPTSVAHRAPSVPVATVARVSTAGKLPFTSPAAIASTFAFPYGCPNGATCLYYKDNAVGRNGQQEPDNEFFYCHNYNISGYNLHQGSIVNNNTGGAQAELFYGKNGTNGDVFVNAGGAFNIDLYPVNSITPC